MIDLLEIVWTVNAFAGIGLSYINGREALLDLQALGEKRNGRRRIATGDLRREALRLLINVVFFVIGLFALGSPTEITDAGFPVTALALVVAAVIYNANGYLDRLDRIYLMHYGVASRDEQGRFTRES